MARTIKEIKEAMTATFVASPTVQLLYGLTPGNTFAQEFSLLSLESILYDVIALGIYTFEKIVDINTENIDKKIEKTKYLLKPWYIETALNFQLGFAIDTMGNYINGLATAEEIEESKIVARVAYEKAVIQGHGVLRFKVVREIDGELGPLEANQLLSFSAYINKKTGFGMRVIAVSRPHDNLTLSGKIWFNPEILGPTGARLDGTDDQPHITAIKAYLKNLEYNGELILTKLVDELQKVEGIVIPKINEASSQWSGGLLVGQLNTGNFEEIRVAFSGYFRLNEIATSFEFIEKIES